MSRRGLFGTAAVGAAALGLAACDSDGTPPYLPTLSAPALDPKDWSSVRAQFALDPKLSHFAAFVFASPPARVRAAIETHRVGFDANPIHYLHANEGRFGPALASAAAAYLGGVHEDEICFTDSTTMGLGLLYSGLKLGPGDEVLTTEHDFYSTHEALRLRSQRDGVVVRKVALYDEPEQASVDQIVSRLVAALTPATKVVAVTWVHSSTGVRLPIRAIADAIKGRGALLCVDGVHGFGAVDAGPAELGCDFLVSGTHKWLFGPRGTGLIWGKREAWQQVNPTLPTFDRGNIGVWLRFQGAIPAPNSATPGGYHAFDHQWALAEAFEFHRQIGRARVAARVTELATSLKAGLKGISGVTLKTPLSPELSAGVVCLRVGSAFPDDLVSKLEDQGVVASSTPYSPSYLRLGPSLATLEADVTRAVDAVRKVA